MASRLSISLSLSSVLLLVGAGTGMAAGQVTEAHAGTRQGAVYAATPEPYVAPGNGAAPKGTASGGNNLKPAVSAGEGGSAPVEPGAGVEIISGGGGGSEGAAKVGHLPVLQ